MDYENKHDFASKGVAGSGLGLGIAGTALGVLNSMGNGGLLSGLLGGNCRHNDTADAATAAMLAGVASALAGTGSHCQPTCNESIPVNRYEAAQNAKIAELTSQIALRDANTFTDQLAAMNDRYSERFRTIEAELARNAVKQQAVDDSIMLVNERLECCKTNIMERLCREIDDRKCADNTIVTYANATFYPKMVADVTVGTTTTAQAVYNPLPIQCCGK